MSRRLTAMVALDNAEHLAERVIGLLSHGRRITLATRYPDRGSTPEVYAGLTPSEEPRVRIASDYIGVGVHLDRPGHLLGFGFSAAAGIHDTEEAEWKRFHAGDRVDMTEVEIVGGLPGDGPARDDLLVITHWNSNGVAIETVVAFDTPEEQW